ncbi:MULTISPECIES: ABC transporter ATP-binding protein [unclassified Pseudoalteromonas]|uniref:ABC transporter ATP-binding protein n=1 Tax=unclassified Pseudoalteromonas TaxID=194690 RepID=UPI000C072B1E|nr:MULTISPECIES: ABC transporter ATP-binding protein [unclassified Pseudoalteromonas]MDP2636125.1 ABC transporter ATP-binding protein [Pseudoalteromonas sp. 1_MG-2023]PHN91070.1 methionine ABC transporter ATP-binding protein [Pseudoalteromonas sp. 3D05]
MITIQKLSFKWHSQQTIPTLTIPSLVIERGEHVFLHGPSGSGKSTLLSLLAGINKPNSGTLNVLDTNLAQLSNRKRDALRSDHIGYIFQNFNLLPYLSPIENVMLGCQFSKPRQKKALQQSDCLEQEAARLLTALGLTTEHHQQNVANLSIGQQQRVAAARAFIGSPELIIADEPTSALDAANRTAFIELLFAQANLVGSTLVFVSHDESLQALFNRSISLVDIMEQAQ